MTWWQSLVDLASQIPGTFWGVIVGSLFTLGGLVLSNWWQDKRQARQLEHTLAKEIYLAATEAINIGLTTVARFGDITISQADLTRDYLAKAHAIAKVHTVASLQTATAITAVLTAISEAMLQLTLARYPVRQAKDRVDILTQQLDRFAKEMDRWLEEAKQYNLGPVKDPQRWNTINGNFEFNDKQQQEAMQARDAATADVFRLNIALMKDAIARLSKIQTLIPPLVMAVRTDLGIKTDASGYSAVLTNSANDQRQHLLNFMKELAALTKK